jgi:hypothetical protein
MKKTVWTFGLIAGAIMSAMLLVTMPLEEMIGPERGEIVGYTTMIAAFLLVFFGVRSYRDNVKGGSVSFGRALALGCLIVLVTSVCYTATWQVIFFGFKSDFIEKYQAHQVEKIRAGGASPAEVEKKVAEMKKFAEMYKNPFFNVAITLVEPLPVGLVIAFVSAGVLSRRRRGLIAPAT